MTEIANYWASSQSKKERPVEEVEDELSLLMDEATAAKLSAIIRSQARVDECHILQKNWETFLFWQRISSNWLYGAMGGIIGLDWHVIHAKISLYHQYPKKQLKERYGFGRVSLMMLEGIETMEREARRILNEDNK